MIAVSVSRKRKQLSKGHASFNGGEMSTRIRKVFVKTDFHFRLYTTQSVPSTIYKEEKKRKERKKKGYGWELGMGSGRI